MSTIKQENSQHGTCHCTASWSPWFPPAGDKYNPVPVAQCFESRLTMLFGSWCKVILCRNRHIIGSGRWVSFAKVAMEICSQDGNDHLYCNDCHRGSYYWDHCTPHCWRQNCLRKPKTALQWIAAEVLQWIARKDQSRVQLL